jgi:DNA-binding transcriptional ArsR family regulator
MRIFLREKPTQALLAVGEMNPAYAALVAKRIDSTFPHTSGILSLLEEHGLVRARPEGRVRYLELTDRGKKTVRILRELSDLLQEPDAKWKMLGRLKEIVEFEGAKRGNDAPDIISSMRLGPLRRDLARMKDSGDSELCKAAEDLDEAIAHKLKRSPL